MALQAGLVGLPNVGKSTLFNALTKSSIPAENFPFCTVDPHIAITQVPDERIEKLQTLFKSEKKIPATMQFVDIAGLVKGASKGEGLGNQFLGNIMQVDLIIHVVRCFENELIVHVHNQVDPISDFNDIISELILKDMDSAQKRKEKLEQLIKSAKTKQLKAQELELLEREREIVNQLEVLFNKEDLSAIQQLVAQAKTDGITLVPFLSGKPFLIAANFDEDSFADGSYKNSVFYSRLIEKFGIDSIIPVSAKIEADLAQLSEEEAAEMREVLGITQSGLDELIQKTYKKLQLMSYFTCGPKEIHTWTIKKGTNVQKAAGEIHSDLERGFIAADVYNAQDLFALGSEAGLRNAGKLRTEGRDYIVKDGDILNIKFNV
ncbi:redox-regulated ATPase YchF [Candidatus Dependentiae bacterium]|nr:redox-regulated ATPase YchF [Candidatus Dependentiae bacterium]